MNLLIVDDEMPAIQSILNIARGKDLDISHIYTALCIKDAIKQFEKSPIDLLLTDIKMPGGSGFELIQWCRERYPSCVIMILSSFPNFSFAQKAITLGVSEYLLKPVEKSCLEEVLRRLAQSIREKSEKTDSFREKPLIKQIKIYIYEHISHDISRNELSDYVNLSPEYLSAFFKKETGYTLSAFIKNERIVFAKRLLRQTNLPISIIAQNTGYDSPAYFSANFKQAVGFTPREYRNNRSIP